jgi:hypothetical protein
MKGEIGFALASKTGHHHEQKAYAAAVSMFQDDDQFRYPQKRQKLAWPSGRRQAKDITFNKDGSPILSVKDAAKEYYLWYTEKTIWGKKRKTPKEDDGYDSDADKKEVEENEGHGSIYKRSDQYKGWIPLFHRATKVVLEPRISRNLWARKTAEQVSKDLDKLLRGIGTGRIVV